MSRAPPCPRCGDPVEVDPEDRAADPAGRGLELCDPCYLAEFELVDAPERLDVSVCSGCGAVDLDGWVDPGDREYDAVAVDAVADELGVHVDAEAVSWEVRPEVHDASTVRVHATFTGVVRSRPVREERTVTVNLPRGTCDRCSRAEAGYHAAVVQVRAAGRSPDPDELEGARAVADRYLADREAKGDRNAFVSRVSETEDGLDLKVSTTQIGRAVADRIVEAYGGTVTDSRRLITEDGDGNRVYRMTFAVRLPPFRPGDVIDPGDGGGPVLVESVTGDCRGRRLRTGGEFDRPHDELDDAVRLGTAADAERTALVAVEDEHAVQVLDPETYRAETVARPDYLDPDAETVRALHSPAGLHVLPEDAPTAPAGGED